MTRRRIGFYGGSFNPPHAGHQATILHALECGDMDKLLVAPVYKHPDGKELVDFQKRVVMTRLMCQVFDSRRVEVGYFEESAWHAGGNGLTVNTLKGLRKLSTIGDAQLVLVLGFDIKTAFPTWEGHQEIEALMAAGDLDVFWVDRFGGWSSTLVRNTIKTGPVAGLPPLRRMLPRTVYDFIEKEGLYK